MEKSIFIVYIQERLLLLAYPSVEISIERTKINLKIPCLSKAKT